MPGPASGLIEAVPFDLTLGAAIASVVPAMPAAIAMTPAEPVLEVLLDGEWLPDQALAPVEGEQPVRDGPTGEPLAASGEPMVLEKNLDSWLAAFGRRERSNRPGPDGESDPHQVQLDEPAAVAAPDRLTTVIPSIGIVARPEAQPKPDPDAPPSDRLAPIVGDGLIDAETLIRTRRVYEPTIEIGGFGFTDLPTLPEVAPEAAANVSAGPASLAGPPPATDVIQLSNQSAPADRPLADVVRRRTVETVKRAELPAPSREPESAGTNRATIAGTVLRQTGGEASPDARTPDRRSEDDRPTGSAEWMPRRRAAEQPTPAEQPTFESRPIPGQASLAAQPVRGEARQPADSPALAAPNPFDRIVRRVDHLTLDLKDDAGDFGRLRVSVSGPLVRATIMPTDPAMADRLNQEIRQLKMTLEQRGFPEPRLTVQAPKPIDPVSWVPVTRDVVVDTGPTAQANTQRRGGDDDRRERWTENRDQRRDEQRQQEQARKPRRDQQGDPK